MKTTTLTCALALGGALLLPPNLAEACGGFFCNNLQPVQQTTERIVFVENDDGTYTGIVGIAYQGVAEEFAWVLPVVGSPEVGVSSDVALTRLDAATSPQYRLTTRVEGDCSAPAPAIGGADASSFAAADGGAARGGVDIVDSGSVGPYDYVTIEVDPESESIADTAVDWLQGSGYDIDDSGRRTLEPYLRSGMNLIAFRLTKGATTGSIRPIRLTFGVDQAGIPIRPTAVAATNDMPIAVWVVGPSRAVPDNYLSLEINEALINWLNPSSNYDAVVTAAADDVGGQGFVTELATPTGGSETNNIFRSFEALERSRFAGLGDADLLAEVTAIYLGWDGLLDVALEHVPVPDETTTVQQVLRCPSCFFGSEPIEGFERDAFLDDIEAQVVAPVRETRELLESRPYLTRLYTTMSPREMTVDPTFTFNADLDDVSNVHTAERVIECHRGVAQWEAPWRVTLSSGEVVRGRGATWPLSTGDVSMPANERVIRYGESGPGAVVEDNTGDIAMRLERNREENPPVPPRDDASFAGMDGCSAGGAAGGGLFGLLALGLVSVRRRRG